MIWVYRIVFLPLLLLMLPYYLWRMYRRGGYASGFSHRFGIIGPIPPRRNGVNRIWLQAVSVGEIMAIGPLLKIFHEKDDVEVVLTTTTSTGYKLAREKYREQTLAMGVFPLDFWPFSAMAWRRISPDTVVLTEGELWPEHIHQAHMREVRLVIINGRLSDRSYRRYGNYPAFCRWLFSKPDLVLAGSEQDSQRYISLGVPEGKVITTGNLKFDVTIEPLLTEDQILNLKKEMGFFNPADKRESPLVLLGSSTWPGEEAALIEVCEKARMEGIDCRLLIVPRHVERSPEIENLLNGQDRPFHFRSKGKAAPQPVDIYVGDTTGELKVLTQVADLVFVGKSLPPHTEGQTPIEAASLGKPLVFGPGMSNFRQISISLLQFGAAIPVADSGELESHVISLLADPAKREAMAARAREWHAANRGAAEKSANALLRIVRN